MTNRIDLRFKDPPLKQAGEIFSSSDSVNKFIANDLIEGLGRTIAQLTERLYKLGADVSDMNYMQDDWHAKMAV
jgi:hypothetical protein